MIRAEVEGIGPIEFEDGTTSEVIQATVKRLLEQRGPNPAEGMSLRVGPFDTGIPLPTKGAEYLAGMGRRFQEIGTLGLNRGDEVANKRLDQSTAATLGGATADVASLLGGGAAVRAAGAIPGVVAAAPRIAQGARVAGQSLMAPQSLGQAATGAGLYTAATTPGSLPERGMAGGISAGLGAAGQAIPRMIGNVIRPNIAPDVEQLRNLNIRMTPGQMMGPTANITEQKLMSLPVVGDFIRGARMRSVEDFNKAIANEVLAPLGVKATKPAGRALVIETQQAVSKAYDDVLPKITTTFNEAINDAIDAGKTLAATAGHEGRFDAIMKQNLYGKFTDPSGFVTGRVFKDIDSGLATAIREAWSKGDRALAEAGQGVRDALRVTASGAPEDLARLKAADTAFAKLVRMENAAGQRGAKEGVFSPAAFGRAVEKGASRQAKAAGTELMGPLSDVAERRLSTTFPESGTAARLLLNAGVLGGAGAAGAAAGYDPTSPQALGALGLIGTGALAYSPYGQAMMRGALMRPGGMLVNDIGLGARSLAPAGGLLAPQLFPVYAGQK